ncbi:MAG: sodium:solute symporter [Bacteroidota bacterium]
MRTLDWIVLVATTLLIVIYGIWKSRGSKNIEAYLMGNRQMKWWTIGLSIMATQASAITFLSTPGQAFDDGMRFVQFYFGLPIAMVLIAIFAIPIYRRLKVYTAYEYLEQRFDLKTRSLGALLFLVSRGLAAGMTIYAPAIIMAVILGWSINLTCIAIGTVVIIYTVSGGTRAVSYTQQQQMVVILAGMFIAAAVMIWKFPPDISFMDSLHIAGKMGKLNPITVPESLETFDPKDRYNLFSGLIGGTFLALAYFGTDQSQVQRYLGGKSVAESRIGLLLNGMIKVPMQFLILFVGILMFVFYQFETPPLFFNEVETQNILQSDKGNEYRAMQEQFNEVHSNKQLALRNMLTAIEGGNEDQVEELQKRVISLDTTARGIRTRSIALMEENNAAVDKNDLDQVFLSFVMNHLPVGLVGLLIAVILAAAMSSTAAELNALATCTLIDVYKRRDQQLQLDRSETHYLNASRVFTFAWGIFAILFSLFADQLGNMIQAVNIIGSLFYGTILGMFVVGFFTKGIGGTATFWGAVLAELLVVSLWILPQWYPDSLSILDIGFLWFNLIGCLAVMLFAILFHVFLGRK